MGIEGLKDVRATYSKFVKLAEGLQPAIVPCIHASTTGGRFRGCRAPRARWEQVRDSAGQYVLAEFLDLMVDRGLERVAPHETQRRSPDFSEEHLARRGLHLNAQADAIDHCCRLIVHRERTGKCLAELDCPE